MSDSGQMVPLEFLAPDAPSSSMWPLGGDRTAVSGYSVAGDIAMYHICAISDQHRAAGTSPGEVLARAVEDGAPRCTFVFETAHALDVMIQQLQDLRREMYDE